MLIPIENVLSKDEVLHFRQQLAAADWQDGAMTAGTLARSAKTNLQLEDGSALAVALGNHILRKLGNHPAFISAALPHRIFPPKFNCYRNGGAYGLHVDSALMAVGGTELTVRSDLSATLFLSEPDEYDGGELQIDGPFGVQAVKLGAGDMVLYPSSSLHQVTPVIRGERIASFFWIQSMVQQQEDRTLLFDLDRAIQGLTPDSTTRPDLITLTQVYHNLLRRWAVT